MAAGAVVGERRHAVGVVVTPTYTATTNGTSPAWLASIASPTRRIEGRMGATQLEALANLRVAVHRTIWLVSCSSFKPKLSSLTFLTEVQAPHCKT